MEKERLDAQKPKIPKEIEKYGRVTIYAGSSERKQRLIALLQLGQGRSLSEMIDIAVTWYLKQQEIELGNENEEGK